MDEASIRAFPIRFRDRTHKLWSLRFDESIRRTNGAHSWRHIFDLSVDE